MRVVAVLTLAYSTVYIVWRWTSTLNLEALWFSIPLAAAETYGLLAAFLAVLTLWKLKHRTAGPAPAGLDVDVFITAYDEPVEVIRKTALAAKRIDYPHETYLLDDGKREALRDMAGDLEIGYIRRETNEHAKAGNLNNALEHTDGEFILQLDADHVALPHILDRLLGFMKNERVAFVQSPQDFYNIDAFTYDIDVEAGRIWDDQRLFFSVIQPGKDNWGAAFFVGSCAVIRRAALDDIGGFSTESITEDIETSLLLHANGWESVFYAESLAYGLAPGSAAAFHVQHRRWGQGAMQVLRKFNPLTHPGLTLPQRLAYLDSLTTYLGGYQKLIFYLSPIVFFATGVFPIDSPPDEFLPVFIPYLALMLINFRLLSRGVGSVLLAERYAMAKFFTHMIAVTGYFARGRLKFQVTPKGTSDVPFRTYAPQLGLAVLTALAVPWSLAAQMMGWLDYGVQGWEGWAFWMNGGWAAWNFSGAASVVQLSLALKQRRQDHRFPGSLLVRFWIADEDRDEQQNLGVSTDLNPDGLCLRTATPLVLGTAVRIVLRLATGAVEVGGDIVHRQDVPANGRSPLFVHGIRFRELAPKDRDAINLHCTLDAVPYWQSRYDLGADVAERAAHWLYDARREPRNRLRLPAVITFVHDSCARERDALIAVLEQISSNGAHFILDGPLAPGTLIAFDVPGTEISDTARVIASRAFETPLAVHFVVAVERVPAAVPALGPRSDQALLPETEGR